MKIKRMNVIGLIAGVFVLLAACDQTGESSSGRETDGWENWEEEEDPRVLVDITVEPPDTLIYALGQPFDPTGMVVEGFYDDGSSRALGESEYTIEMPDMTVAAAKVVTVKAAEGAFTKRFQISVRNDTKILRSIAITRPATKTAFEIGQDLSTTGMVVTGDFFDSASQTQSYEPITAYKTTGYSKLKRGTQAIKVKANGQSAAPYNVTVSVPASAAVSVSFKRQGFHNHFLKGQAFNQVSRDIMVKAQVNGIIANFGHDDLSITDFSGYNSDATGQQALTLRLDQKTVSFNVQVLDVEPHVYFDYGYMRLPSDLNGVGPGSGKYYAQAGEKLTLSAVRFLIGYDANNQDAGVTYSWSVTQGTNYTAPHTTGEFFDFTPNAAGTYTVQVSVTGRDYITGQNTTKIATTDVVCYSGTVQTAKTFPDAPGLRNFAPGQFTSGGNGFGWSLGAQGGYRVWRVDSHQDSYYIGGNAFGQWLEPGVVWMMEDKNNNNIPDEMWYELKGGEDDTNPSQITRRYGLMYFHATGESINQYGQPVTGLPWVDSKGRTGTMEGGWPRYWGVSDAEPWVLYTGTLLRDTGEMVTNYNIENMFGYVDALNGKNHAVSKARRADGSPANLTNVRFIKVQTAFFAYGNMFGEISTEIGFADGLGVTTDFPMPSGAY
ncbi:MAG: bacterial Ig-like domain-containing protein [Spirochaetaceae bacterium]|jgi:hypothetical protein|nr:bacterial Ig-like domain-containing protein [Spirochaetaceae bacterium]